MTNTILEVIYSFVSGHAWFQSSDFFRTNTIRIKQKLYVLESSVKIFHVCPFGEFYMNCGNRLWKAVYQRSDNRKIDLKATSFIEFSNCVYQALAWQKGRFSFDIKSSSQYPNFTVQQYVPKHFHAKKNNSPFGETFIDTFPREHYKCPNHKPYHIPTAKMVMQ